MVERYALSPMKNLWTVESNLRRWLDVEFAVMEAYEQLGLIPHGVTEKARKNAMLDLSLFEKYERETDHEIIAFIKMATRNMGDEARYFHYGLTSSDVIDTALSLALVEACGILLEELRKLLKSLWELANKHKYTITIGRTHGVHAEPTSFGLKVLNWYAEMKRDQERLEMVKEQLKVGKISGAVGNYANVPPQVEELALRKLDLKPTPVSSQIVNRDHHAFFVMILALIASGIERIATEIRHLQRTEVLEAQEPFKEGQKGSSAMPHKQNPVLCERLCGLSRVVRSFVNTSLENNNLWHERDISHSSAERYIFPDVTQTLHYMLVKTNYLVQNLVVHEDKMMENLSLTRGLIYSERVMLKLVEKGMKRSEAYDLVQSLALRCWRTKEDFRDLVEQSIPKLNREELEEIFDPKHFLRWIDQIFSRFEGE